MRFLSWAKRELIEHVYSVDLDSIIREVASELAPRSTTAPPPESKGQNSARSGRPPNSAWLPAGRAANIGGYLIKDGLIYVGRGLPALGRHQGVEPALIDPRLPVDAADPDRPGDGLHYYPSYSNLSPRTRADYLRWLAGGRKDRGVPPSFVYLFFYGFERRLLGENAWDDADAIVAEVERLAEIYGARSSFGSRAMDFLLAVELLRGGSRRVYEMPLTTSGMGWDMPLRLKVGLGQLSVDGKPVPAEWGLAWLRSHPDIRLHMPATRCPEEFDQLFLLRYREQYGEGFIIKPNKRRLWGQYYTASHSFGGRSIRLPVGDLPDVTMLKAQLNKLTSVAERCYLDLGAYSRWLGRNPEGRGSLQAVALLPAELAASSAGSAVKEFSRWVEERLGDNDSTVLEASDLISRWSPDSSGKLTKAAATGLAQLLAGRGYGVEPDVRFGGLPLSEGPAVLFRLGSGAPDTPGRAYTAAMVLAHLAVAVACADGRVSESERRYITDHIQALPDLSAPERQRLAAHLQWRLATGAKLTGIKPRLFGLPPEARPAIGRFVVGVAAADGVVPPDMITLLGKVYRLLELPPNDVYSDIHAVTVAQPSREPVTVRRAFPSRPGYSIPAPRSTARELALDASRIEAKMADTAAVSALLGAIFVDEEEAPERSEAEVASHPGEPDAPSIAGLDAAHSSLLRALAGQPGWSREEVAAMAGERGLLPDGALDTINEAAMEACGELVCEGDDPVEINMDALKELSA